MSFFLQVENGRQRHRRRDAGARVYRTTNQTVVNNTAAVLSFNAEYYDTDNIWNGSQSTRLTCNTAGHYFIGGHARFASNGTNARSLFIRLNGSPVIAVDSAAASAKIDFNIMTSYRLAVGDYVELLAFQDSGVNLDVLSVARHSPEFWMVLSI